MAENAAVAPSWVRICPESELEENWGEVAPSKVSSTQSLKLSMGTMHAIIVTLIVSLL